MDNNTITVTVSGSTGVGKSAIAAVIYSALAQHGIDVTVDFQGETHSSVVDALPERIAEIAKRRNVHVIERNVPRPAPNA